MNTRVTAAITAVHGYVPEDVLSNERLEGMVETNDAWITERTGICLLYTSDAADE